MSDIVKRKNYQYHYQRESFIGENQVSFHIVRSDITKMNTEAIVNTANAHVTVGPGCDSAVYEAPG